MAGSSFVPVLEATRNGTPVTRVEARSAFYLRAHPERWQIMGGQLLPLLGRLPIMPGLNGAELGRGGAVRMATAKARCEERGWTIIPFDAVPKGHGSSYLWQPEGRPDLTLLIYERAYPGSTETRCDEAGLVEFLANLVDSGIVDPAPAYIIEKMLEKSRGAYSRAQDAAQTVPSKRIDVERIGKEIAVLEAALVARVEKMQPVGGSEVVFDD